ncbi:UDP-N-acetylglucosamine 1-carboxyvinyltransferase [Cohnella lubricantis]|uniref:UDP-N-acetylglucosamine 1-carboxyvinyltransferase n=1 Tax=Cohnella lubricantis TaxID=2163172 RepID=A0A841TEB0_9BACL|nr:UDP-N-acetylglucosamine 1-carboxyvinyltransferase [Cohnella lubricantis]MBB6677317.1 UDP-N-acetylglucosamine 1-carboxyvinyltransferase [Cohnella lubricantis]MBP2116871.1 UDP-N-acetylglucosamine 1-carboxyvinyltransferase [Cohnella lubricantis]
MDKLVIEGGKPLSGTIRIHGAKNAALPILAASMLAEEAVTIRNVPRLLDIEVMLHILQDLGCKTNQTDDQVTVDSSKAFSSHVPEHLMRQMRSSVFLMGPLLARFGEVEVYQPGGCAIGERKIDLHLRGLQALGAELRETGSRIVCTAKQLVGAEIILDFPSVGATENIMLAAVLAKGRTTIVGAAREPEIQDLQRFLNEMGGQVRGAGTDTIIIDGVPSLSGCEFDIIPDRIVTGTVMVAAAATRGSVTLEGTQPGHLTSLIHVLRRAGVHIEVENGIMRVGASARPRAVDRVVTSPYPAFPTDLQAQLMILLSLADGVSVVKETVFEGRFKHVEELCRMGANIRLDLNTAFIRGVPKLYGSTVEATDLRAGAALVIAGLAAHGTTIVEHVHHIDRGYDRIEGMFASLGADIVRLPYESIAASANR